MTATARSSRPPLLADAWAFFRRPAPSPEPDIDRAGKAARTLRAWSITYLLAVPLGCIATVGMSVLGRSLSQHALVETLREASPWATLVLAVAVAPVLEECVFRLGLRPTRLNVSVGAAALAVGALQIGVGLLPDGSLPADVASMPSTSRLAVQVALGAALATLLWKVLPADRIAQAAHSRFGWLLYGSAALFALMHAFNFGDLGWAVLAAPLLTLPQFALGLTLGYVRVRFGFAWAVLAHAMNNAVSLGPVLAIAIVAPQALGGPAGADPLSATQNLALANASLAYLAVLALCLVSLVWSLVEWCRPAPAAHPQSS